MYLRLVIFVCLLITTSSSFAKDIWAEEQVSFLPTWKLLNTEQKQHFIAGYLQAWKDAAQVTDIAMGYIKENPDKALEGLGSVRAMYETQGLRPADLAHQIDLFYKETNNRDATLSRAMSYAKSQMR
jgi:hypothetical protein